MDTEETLRTGCVVVLLGLLYYLPKRFSQRQRVYSGIALFFSGWAGIFSGLALDDAPFLQDEAVAYGWMGISAVAIVLGITLLMPVAFERLRAWRPRRW